jgi:transposase
VRLPPNRGGIGYKESHAREETEVRSGVPGGFAVRLVNETGKSVAAAARDLGINEGTLGNWVALDRQAREGTKGLNTGDIEELKRLRAENAELRMERDVLKRSVVLWVKEATK